MPVAFWLFSPRLRVGHALRSFFMLWLVKIWQVSSCGKFMQHVETCLLWQQKLTEFCVNLWCFSRSFSTECTKWNLLPRVFCYSWLVCFLGFWLRNTSLVNIEWVQFAGPYIAGGQGGSCPRQENCFFFSNIVFDFVGLFLVAILFRNLKKTD